MTHFIITFVVASRPCCTHFKQKRKEAAKKGRVALHKGKVFAKATFLELLNVGNSITQNRNIAEVDTTGRYMNCPGSVQRLL